MEFSTTYGQSEKLLGTLRKVHRLCDFIQNHFEACEIFYNMWEAIENIEKSQDSPEDLYFI